MISREPAVNFDRVRSDSDTRPAQTDTLITLPDSPVRATSIRATAQVFEDPKSVALLSRLRQIAPSEANVLLTGETGTGKEVIARHVHALSRRRHGPFIAVNCGAFAESLVESELFGHEKGAFTGAFSARPGWFEAAAGGTLFLDEIGDLPLKLQVKLLRVLQEREVVRLGSRKPVPIDVRIIAATHVRLEEAVAAGKFREDLFYRLGVVVLGLPALRDRPGDILPLAQHFLAVYRQRLGQGNVPLHPDAERKLLRHPWPGNIRELENAIHHALLVSESHQIRAEDLQLSSLSLPDAATGPADSAPQPAEDTLRQVLLTLFERPPADLFDRIEDTVLRTAYEHCRRNQVHTARLLGISRNAIRSRLIRIGVIDARR